MNKYLKVNTRNWKNIRHNYFYMSMEKIVKPFRGHKTWILILLINYYIKQHCQFIDTFYITLFFSAMILLIKEWADRKIREYIINLHIAAAKKGK